jgi:membrane-associated phospholipid phosphatase
MTSRHDMRPRFTLLPGEWVLGGFLLFAFVRLAFAGHLTLDQGTVPRVDLFLGFLIVVCIRLLADYRRTPWPREAHAQRRPHLAFLGLFCAFVPFVFLKFPNLRPANGWEGASTKVFLVLYGWSQVALMVVVPFLIFWLASAQYIKRHGALDSVGMVREGWRPAVDTIRQWFPLIALFYCYGLMGPVIGRGLFGDQDVVLARIDRVMFFGHDPSVLCEALISRPLSEWLCSCYVFYLPLFPIVLAWLYARPDPGPFREVCFAASLTMAVGYISYTVVPAQGPLFTDHFDVPLDAYLLEPIKAQLMDRTRVPRDCFPSLHTAASLTLLWGAFRHVRPLFWMLAPIVLSIPFACVYLRYHYVIDVLAGVALFAGVATLTVHSRWLQAAFHAKAEP